MFSGISSVEGFGESDAEEILDSLAGVDLIPDTADSSSTSQGSRPGSNGSTESVNSNSSSPGADLHLMSWSRGVNLALVKTTTTYPKGRVEKQHVASVGYTESVKPEEIDPQALFKYLQREFVEYMSGKYFLK